MGEAMRTAALHKGYGRGNSAEWGCIALCIYSRQYSDILLKFTGRPCALGSAVNDDHERAQDSNLLKRYIIWIQFRKEAADCSYVSNNKSETRNHNFSAIRNHRGLLSGTLAACTGSCTRHPRAAAHWRALGLYQGAGKVSPQAHGASSACV